MVVLDTVLTVLISIFFFSQKIVFSRDGASEVLKGIGGTVGVVDAIQTRLLQIVSPTAGP